MKKLTVLFAIVTAVIAIVMLSPTITYGVFTDQAFKNFGYASKRIPIVMVRTAKIESDIHEVQGAIRNLSGLSGYMFQVNENQMLESFTKRVGFTYDGRKISSIGNDDYMQTFAMHTKGKKNAVCFVRVGTGLYDRLETNKGSLEDRLKIVHEASHCPQLGNFYKRKIYEDNLPGLRYLKSTEIFSMYKQNEIEKKEAIFLLKYTEYIREIAADYSTLMYMRYEMGASNSEVKEVISSIKGFRSKKNLRINPNSVGHHTLPYLELVEKDISVLDNYKSEFHKDSVYASMKMAYDLGKNHSYTFKSFYRKYKKLNLTTSLL